jgi:hypothetical protein
MFRRTKASITAKVSLAVLLLVFSVIAAGGAMPCIGGEPMVAVKAEAVQTAMEPDHSCCKPKAAVPKPVEKKSNCCCFDTLKKNAVDFSNGKATDYRIDFSILPPAPVNFEIAEPEIVVAQIRWPEVHGPPGIERHPVSPRAPPQA